MNVQNQLSRPAAEELLSRDTDQLYELLGLRLKATEEDLNKQGNLEPEIEYPEHLGLMEDLQKIGRRVFNKIHTQAYTLVCGTSQEDEADRNKIIAAFGIGAEATVIALTSVLISTFGLAAAIAGVVAALIVRRFGEPALNEGHAAMCEIWREYLPDNR